MIIHIDECFQECLSEADATDAINLVTRVHAMATNRGDPSTGRIPNPTLAIGVVVPGSVQGRGLLCDVQASSGAVDRNVLGYL